MNAQGTYTARLPFTKCAPASCPFSGFCNKAQPSTQEIPIFPEAPVKAVLTYPLNQLLSVVTQPIDSNTRRILPKTKSPCDITTSQLLAVAGIII